MVHHSHHRRIMCFLKHDGDVNCEVDEKIICVATLVTAAVY